MARVRRALDLGRMGRRPQRLLAAEPCVGAIAKDVFNGMADGIVGATGLVGGQGFAVGLVVIVVKQLFGAPPRPPEA